MLRWLSDVVPNVNPDPSQLPGAGTFQSLVGGVVWFALIGCLVAVIIGGVTWAFGASSSNTAAASKGQKTVVGGIVGAVVIGAASILINFAYGLGHGLH